MLSVTSKKIFFSLYRDKNKTFLKKSNVSCSLKHEKTGSVVTQLLRGSVHITYQTYRTSRKRNLRLRQKYIKDSPKLNL